MGRNRGNLSSNRYLSAPESDVPACSSLSASCSSACNTRASSMSSRPWGRCAPRGPPWSKRRTNTRYENDTKSEFLHAILIFFQLLPQFCYRAALEYLSAFDQVGYDGADDVTGGGLPPGGIPGLEWQTPTPLEVGVWAQQVKLSSSSWTCESVTRWRDLERWRRGEIEECHSNCRNAFPRTTCLPSCLVPAACRIRIRLVLRIVASCIVIG